MATLNFDANTVAPATGQQDAIPAGWYDAMIEKSEMKPTKNGDGHYLELVLNVCAGQYQGRKLFTRLNIMNANPVAKEIAYKELSAICHATGVIQCADSQQLHNIPMKVKVSLKPADGQYEASNDVKAYRNINENVGSAPVQGAPAPFAPPAPPAFAAPAPQAYQMPAQAPQQMPMGAQAPQWQQPAAQQPWQQPAPQQAPQQPAPQQYQQQPQQPAWANGAPQQGVPAPQQAPSAPQYQQQPAGPQFTPPAAPPWATQPAPVAA